MATMGAKGLVNHSRPLWSRSISSGFL